MLDIILLPAFDVNIPKRSHRCQRSRAPDSFIWESVEIEREGETGFGNHSSGPKVAGFTVGLDHRLDCG